MKEIISIALIMSTVINIVSAQTAQKAHQQNPYGLVYEGAITENVKGKVNIHPVTYKIKNITIATNVYTPPNYDATHIQTYWKPEYVSQAVNKLVNFYQVNL
jgi:uncharacterized protein